MLFAENGFDATTMDAVASAADTSVGSVYQFFPNKLAVFRGVSDRCHERARVAFSALVGPTPAERDVGSLIDIVVDGFCALQESDPSFRAVWANTQLWREFEEEDLKLERELVAATSRIFEAYAPDVAMERRETVAQIMVQTVSAGLFLILRDPIGGRRKNLIAELKTMLRAYAAELAASVES